MNCKCANVLHELYLFLSRLLGANCVSHPPALQKCFGFSLHRIALFLTQILSMKICNVMGIKMLIKMPRQFNVGSGSILLDVFSYEVKTLYSKKAVH